MTLLNLDKYCIKRLYKEKCLNEIKFSLYDDMNIMFVPLYIELVDNIKIPITLDIDMKYNFLLNSKHKIRE